MYLEIETLPLGLLPESRLASNPKFLEISEKVALLDFSKAVRRMRMENPSMSDIDVAAAEEDHRRFLALAGVATESFSPSANGDKLWHAQLSYTADYRAMCRELYNGRFLDHLPFEHEDHEEAILDVAKLQANRKSIELWTEAYGVPPLFAKHCCCSCHL